MTPITRQGGEPHDSGVQPQPHYCTVRVDADGRRHGCPDWPHCIFRGTAAVPGQPADPDDDAEDIGVESDDDEVPDIARDLAALAGFAAGAVVFLVVAFTLVLVMIR